jgi:L-aminopeptidase/D-esterase-like protein
MSSSRPRSGTLTDVEGLRVGHSERTTDGWLSGTTVVVGPPDGVVASVDVRGGAPGTRETDLLRPDALVERIHALVLTGGSAYGLAAASGVVDALGADGIGFRVGPEPGAAVPIVPAAVIYDLGRGGSFTCRPGPPEGVAALRAASTGPVRQGSVGAGTGARAGGLKGGIGSFSLVVADTWTVAALVVVNAAGSPVAPDGSLYAAAYATAETDEVLARAPRADPVLVAELQAAAVAAAMNTTIGVVATDATLTKAQCSRLAMAGQDGVARAVRPAHLLVDGDTIFGVSTAARPAPHDRMINAVLAAAADCVASAIGHGMLAATSQGSLVSFRDLAAR